MTSRWATSPYPTGLSPSLSISTAENFNSAADHVYISGNFTGATWYTASRFKLWNSSAGEESDAPQALYYDTQPQWSTSGMYEPLATAVVELTGRNRGGYWQHHGRIS